jgi:acetyl esterase/lipase
MDSIRNPDENVNTKSFLSANGVAQPGGRWQIMGEDVARKDVPILDQLAEEMAAQRKRERKGSAELSTPLFLDNGMAWHYIENESDLLTDEIRILEVTFMAQTVEQLRKGIAESDAKRDAGLTTPENIQRFDDLCYGDDPQWNTLDVYRPKGEEGLLPMIISIHGGGWVYGDKELYSHYCMRLAQRGFAVVNFSYRLAPENKYPAALEDICKVCHWVMAHGAEYQMDLGNIFMLGDSAGGQLCHQILTILTNPRYASMFDFEMPSGFRVNACALNCGCYFVPLSRLTPPQGMTKMYLPEDYMSVAKQMKVIDHTTKDFPPAMVMSARYDFLKFMAAPMYRKLKRRGVPCRLQIYGKRGEKHIGHVFHLDCRSDLAAKCNDDQCAFFREYLR